MSIRFVPPNTGAPPVRRSQRQWKVKSAAAMRREKMLVITERRASTVLR